MPQMAPLNWLTLMIMFISALILFNIMNYYSTSYYANMKKSSKEKKTINWKW